MKRLFKIGLIVVVSCLLTGFYSIAQNKIISYQYWFDNDYNLKTSSTVSSTEQLKFTTEISLAQISNGLHTFTIRFKDDMGLWSIPSSQFFYYIDLTNKKITSYQYWFDNDFSTNKLVSVTLSEQIQLTEQLSLEGINDGLHTINIRFKDSKGEWSSPVNQYFYKSGNIAGNKIIGYRYWLDEDIEHSKYVSLDNPSQLLSLNEDLDFSGLSSGEYTIHFQFKDTSDNWSIATSDIFTLISTNFNENIFAGTLLAYPNPTTGVIYFDLGTIYSSVEIKIFDNFGRMIQQLSYRNEKSLKINLSNSSIGNYYISIKADGKIATFQFIKN